MKNSLYFNEMFLRMNQTWYTYSDTKKVLTWGLSNRWFESAYSVKELAGNEFKHMLLIVQYEVL